MGPHAVSVFTPYKLTRGILEGVAILGQVEAPSFNVKLHPHEQNLIAKALVNLSRVVTPTNLNDYLQGERTFVPKVLCFSGKASWVSTIVPVCHDQSTSRHWQPAPSSAYRPPTQDTIFLTCPNCLKVEPSLSKDFQPRDLDVKHKAFTSSVVSSHAFATGNAL